MPEFLISLIDWIKTGWERFYEKFLKQYDAALVMDSKKGVVMTVSLVPTSLAVHREVAIRSPDGKKLVARALFLANFVGDEYPGNRLIVQLRAGKRMEMANLITPSLSHDAGALSEMKRYTSEILCPINGSKLALQVNQVKLEITINPTYTAMGSFDHLWLKFESFTERDT